MIVDRWVFLVLFGVRIERMPVKTIERYLAAIGVPPTDSTFALRFAQTVIYIQEVKAPLRSKKRRPNVLDMLILKNTVQLLVPGPRGL